ncbi:hypothetical protein [Paeniglutamicibacter sp. NPDC091659]|uniref:hypothetical protein n=1 Tax=Paeniglutamicibacter sp. NPDC091659 TaxID=3364389 RepID=UPI003815E701
MRDLILSSLRRWYFLLAGLLLTSVVTYLVFGMVSPTFEAKASMVLIPPKVAVTVGDNPYLYLGGLDQALGVLQVKVASPSESAALIDKYPGAEISIAKDATTSGPIVSIQVSANDANDTMELLKGAVALVPKTLSAMQTELKVPDKSMISVLELSTDNEPTKVTKKQLQMTMIVAAGGASASLLVTGLLDRLLNRRKSKREAKKMAAGTFTGLLPVDDDNVEETLDGKFGSKQHRRTRHAALPTDASAVESPTADVGT